MLIRIVYMLLISLLKPGVPLLQQLLPAGMAQPGIPLDTYFHAQRNDQCENVVPLKQRMAIGGHRGMGANVVGVTDLPQYRENTLRSFQAARAAGADFVEFDVQVTQDGVPVLWHDDRLILEAGGGVDSKYICNMTLPDFQAAHDVNMQGVQQKPGNAQAVLRQAPGQAGEARWCVQQDDRLPTLREVLTALSPGFGVNIEVKLATPADLAATPPGEVNRMVDAILPEVEAAAASHPRPVLFSSFDPDICAALRARQAAAPVFFLSDCGLHGHADARRTSLAAALAWAAECGLQGVVLDSAAPALDAGAVAEAAARGLAVLTYGHPNNDPAHIVAQRAMGMAGAIVDDVRRIVRALAAVQQPMQRPLVGISGLDLRREHAEGSSADT